MIVYAIMDATHYPVAIYMQLDRAHKDLAERNRNETMNRSYLVSTRIVDWEDYLL